MFEEVATRRVCAVLLCTRPERDRLVSPLVVALIGHALMLFAAFWMTNVPLPTGVAPAERPHSAIGEVNTHIVLISPPRAAFHRAASQQARASGPRTSRGFMIDVAHLNVESNITLHPDTLLKSSAQSMWVLAQIPRSDSVGAVPVTLAELSRAPRVTSYSRAPHLKNGDYIRRFLERHFPGALRRDGGEARTIVWLLIDVQGNVLKSLLRETSGRAPVDSVALAASLQMEFAPAEQAGRPVPVWVQQPVRFRVQ
jgi:TonB family protein